MSSDVPYVIRLLMDMTQPDAELARTKAEQDAIVREWREKRQIMLNEMRDVQMSINLMIQSIRTAFNVVGIAMDPVESALLSMISSSTSLMLSVAVAMGSTGWLAGIALVLAGIALELQWTQTTKLIVEMDWIKKQFEKVDATFAAMEFAGGRL